MNVSSIAVKAAPEHLEEVIYDINSLKLCEVHFYDTDGRVVVTIEGESIHDQMGTLKRIQDIRFVLSASLVYSYCEDELAKALGQIEGRSHNFSQN
jgi:nitrate reductase NapAB chaperone NapD